MNVNKISLPLAQDSQLLLQHSTVAGRCNVELCAGKRGVNPDFVTTWQLSRMCCTPFNSNINDRSAIFREALSFARMWRVSLVSLVSCRTALPLVLSFTVACLGSYRSLSHQKLNIADLLLFQNIFHLPKYTGPAFLTLRSDLCIWSGNAVKGETGVFDIAGLKER